MAETCRDNGSAYVDHDFNCVGIADPEELEEFEETRPRVTGLEDERILKCNVSVSEVEWIMQSAGSEGSDVSAEITPPEQEERPLAEAEANFRAAAIRSLERDLVEDGEVHDLEKILEVVLCKFPTDAPDWIQKLFRDLLTRPLLAAGMLQCVGRLPVKDLGQWGYSLAMMGLWHPDLGIREAAVTALEWWSDDDDEAIRLLEYHSETVPEPVPWLSEYVRRLLEALIRKRGTTWNM